MATQLPFRLHNEAKLLGQDPVTVETASAKWSYAAQFDLPHEETSSDREVTVEIEVTRGEVGVGLLTVDGTAFHVERQVTEDEGLVSIALPLRADQPCGGLVLRNVGGAGKAAVFRIRSITTCEVSFADRPPQETRFDSPPPQIPLRLHNGARLLEPAPVTVETASEQWSYAAQFDLPYTEAPSDQQVTVEVEVTRGEVGIGLLTVDGTAFYAEHQVIEGEGQVSIAFALTANQQLDSLVVRNVGAAGKSAVFRISAITTREVSSEQGRAAVPAIDIPSSVFRRFRLYSGEVPAGFWINWLGVKTRSTVWPFHADIQALYARTRHERCRYPLHDEHVLDWVPLLEAVLSTRETFRMIALGAGWGRWLSGGAFAAAQLGLRFHLTGVEAEPNHFAWMEQHMRDNVIDPAALRLIHGAASASDEPCWFPVAAPDWYGQSIVAETRVSDAAATSEETVVDGVRLRRIPTVKIEQVISGASIVDYLHLDIQGTEYEFLSQDPARLAACVRVVNIGTHSHLIERRLRSLFGQLGWELRYDVSIGSKAHVSVDGERTATIEFGDGVQVWSNPLMSAS